MVTVLSPVGLNVRARPSKKAAVIGTASQGAVLQLVAHAAEGGGWYKVRGATALGWMTANPLYSARGRFDLYQSARFNVLFPAGWAPTGSPAAGVHFRAPIAGETVVITSAASVKKLPLVPTGAGAPGASSEQVVACGITTQLRTFTTSSPGHFLVGLRFPIDAHHALGLRATLTSLSQLPAVLDFVNSLTFPFPVCVGRPPKAATTTT
ncbi:MAG TPA: SH3 domain-containing protein [Acidimicrobiales bacterium]|nr:SH3 domain-containing protein [Acidimicrobiales bacterium]